MILSQEFKSTHGWLGFALGSSKHQPQSLVDQTFQSKDDIIIVRRVNFNV